MRVGYRRVSASDQNLDRQQLGDVEKIFDEYESGAKLDRPGLIAAIDFVRDGDKFIVYSIDRLARSLIDLEKIMKALLKKGVTIIFLKERLEFSGDVSRPIDTLQFQIMSAFAQFERSIIKERQKEGIMQARAKGKHLGRPNTVPNDKVRALNAEGNTPTQIACELGISRASVYRVLNISTDKVD